MSKVNVSSPETQIIQSGRYIFRDDFDDLTLWKTIAGTPSVSGSILSLSGTNTEVRSKRKFLYGIFVVIAKSDVAGNLQIGFDDGGNDYVVWSGGNLRYKSTVDPTEGSTAVAPTETNYNVFVILWHADEVLMWVNGTAYGPYQAMKIPNKPLPISLKNLSTGTSSIDLVIIYPELVGTWLQQVGYFGTSLQIPVGIQAGSSRIGYVGIVEKLLATPYTDTTTALGAGATFTGTARDTQIDSSAPYSHYGNFRAAALADQAGTLYIDESPDNTTWINGVKSVAVSANVVATLEHKSIYRYVRVRYVNGSVAQTSFRLWSRLAGVG